MAAPPDPADRDAFIAWAAERQKAYEKSRIAWAKAIGRPYAPQGEGPQTGSGDGGGGGGRG